MIVLDTCVLLFEALEPERVTDRARQAILAAEQGNQLVCSDISKRRKPTAGDRRLPG